MSDTTATAPATTTDKVGTQMMYKVPFSKLVIEEGLNLRTFYGDIDELAQSIYENGVKSPMRGRKREDGMFIVTDGHRRHRAMKIVFETHNIDVIANFVIEDKKTTDEQRVVDMFVANDGLPFTQLEMATGVERLINFGWSYEQIAQKLSKSAIYIRKLEKLAAAPEKLKKLIRKNAVSATYAGELIQQNKVDEFLEKVESGEITLETPTKENNGSSKRAAISKGTSGMDKNSIKDLKRYLKETDKETAVAEDKQEFFDFLVRLFENKHTARTIKSFFKKVPA